MLRSADAELLRALGDTMDRRTLLKLGASGVMLPAMLVACDGGGAEFVQTDDQDSGDVGDSGAAEGVCNTATSASGESDTHGHALMIPAADLASGLGGTYPCTGGGHPHDVTLTADDMSALLDNCTVTVESQDGGHPHTWVITLPES
jgi:hypothetical protein